MDRNKPTQVGALLEMQRYIKVERFTDLEVWPCKVEAMALLICRSR